MRADVLSQFVSCGNWFERQYQVDCDARYPTFKAALNLWLQSGGQTIVETGCVRREHDFGAGYSTVLFGEVTSRYGGLLWSIDNDPAHLQVAARLAQPFASHCRFLLGDSVDVLERQLVQQPEFSGRIDLLYLDSFDYPTQRLEERLMFSEQSAASRAGGAYDHDQIAAEHADLVDPPQRHCLAELNAAWPMLHGDSIVLIDDNRLPGGGKSRLAKRRLAELGWRCVLDSQQSLWLPPA